MVLDPLDVLLGKIGKDSRIGPTVLFRSSGPIGTITLVNEMLPQGLKEGVGTQLLAASPLKIAKFPAPVTVRLKVIFPEVTPADLEDGGFDAAYFLKSNGFLIAQRGQKE